jgi:hypothetical protein
MPLSTQLKTEIEVALTLIEQHPQHEYGPSKRKKLFQVWESLKGPVPDKAYRWLAIITAEKVLPFYSLELQPQAQALFDAQKPTWSEHEHEENQRSEQEVAAMPHTAVELAIQVMRGEADAGKASDYCASQHYTIGNLEDFFLLPRANFVNLAANDALGEASCHGERVFYPLASVDKDSTKTDLDWDYYRADTAAYAAAAWAYDADTDILHPERLLEFWRWWLLEAIPRAWDIAQQVQDKT